MNINSVIAADKSENATKDFFDELRNTVYKTLETYSNVHRGSGYFSRKTTEYYEEARESVLEFSGLDKKDYTVIFCTPSAAEKLCRLIEKRDYTLFSSADFGFPLGVRAVVLRENALPKGKPFQSGGGTARLVSTDWVIWARGAEKFEAGTPPIVNIIAFACLLRLSRNFEIRNLQEQASDNSYGKYLLHHDDTDGLSGLDLFMELRKELIGNQMPVITKRGEQPYINFDNAASTQTFRQVWDTVLKLWKQSPEVLNEIIAETRSVCADFFNAPSNDYEIIFTSNTTEAINHAADAFHSENGGSNDIIVLTTLLEHTSNDLPWRRKNKNAVIRLGIDDEGFIDPILLENTLAEYNFHKHHGNERIGLVSISGGSNVLGCYNDLKKISEIAHKYGARILADAAQLAAHRKIDMKDWDLDYLAFSAHKLYAPFGSGALIVRKGLISSSFPEKDNVIRSGEENVTGIAALGKSIILLQKTGMNIIEEEERKLTLKALTGLSSIEGLKVFGANISSERFDRKGGVIVFSMKKIWPDKLASALAGKGIGVRYGCHCAHLLVKRLLNVPHALEQFQGVMLILLPTISLPGVVRISFGIGNTADEIDRLIEALKDINANLK
jgi:selenocysteine lyase/cysteine desulfurase